MKPTFTEKQLSLIGECVLATIINLRKTAEQIDPSSAKELLEPKIEELNEILRTLAAKSKGNGVKIGDVIHIINLDDSGGSDTATCAYAGRTGTVQYIDDAGQIHGTWGSLGIIPEVDEFIIIKNN